MFTAVFLQSRHCFEPLPLLFAALWWLHYGYRSFVYPFRIRGGHRPKPVLTVALAVLFNCANGGVNGYAITELAPHLTGSTAWQWWSDPRLIAGLVLFAVGLYINHSADATLRSLRSPGETGYKIPHGGLFRWVSCPNYLGEIIEWCGFALACWTGAGAAFAWFTFANLTPRALAHHRWYQETFSDYPEDRRAILPFLL